MSKGTFVRNVIDPLDIYGTVTGETQRDNLNSQRDKYNAAIDDFLKGYDERIGKRETDYRSRLKEAILQANKNLSTSTASNVAQVTAGAGARGAQSGISGANVEALVSESTRPIYQEQSRQSQNIQQQSVAGEQSILDFLASAEENRANIVLGKAQANLQYDAAIDSISPLKNILGLTETALNIAAVANGIPPILKPDNSGIGTPTVNPSVGRSDIETNVLNNVGKPSQPTAPTYKEPVKQQNIPEEDRFYNNKSLPNSLQESFNSLNKTLDKQDDLRQNVLELLASLQLGTTNA